MAEEHRSGPDPRAPRRRDVLYRRVRRALAATALTAVTIVGAVYVASQMRLRQHISVPTHSLRIPSDEASVARGRHLAATRGCTACHGVDFGGRELLRNAALGLLTAPNLTALGGGSAFTDADWERAVRHGVRRDGTPLIQMPAHELSGLADADVAAIVAFARSLPRQKAELPAPRLGPLARLLLVIGYLPLLPAELVDHSVPHPTEMPPAPTAEYGAYLATGCTSCHGARLTGGPIRGAPPSFPPASDLTRAGLARWSEADFRRAMRDGLRPDGTALRRPMPLELGREMTDVELTALWAYLQTL